MKNLLKILVIVCIIFGFYVVNAGIFYQIPVIKKIYSRFVLDSKEHFLTCDQLPSTDKVNQIMNEHKNTIQKIEKINPGFIFVTTGDYDDCVDKSDIVISYPSHQNKLEIEKIINGKTFFEIPYRLQNQ